MRHGRSRFERFFVTPIGVLEVDSDNSTLRAPDEFRNGVHTEIIFHLKINLTKSFSAGLGRAIAAGTALL